MLGDLVFSEGETLEVVWDGEADRAEVVPPLCSRHVGMESPLADMMREQYGLEQRQRNRPKETGYQLTERKSKLAQRELRGMVMKRGGKP